MPALEQFLESIASLEDVPEENVLLKELATSIAMKAAKYQHSLHLEELVTLKDQLLSSSNPQFTPRGKTIITELSKDQLNDL
jgi:DNA mismatch repair ATPase MutL